MKKGLVVMDERFAGMCPVCNEPIQVGQTIVGAVDKDTNTLKVAHVGCEPEFNKLMGVADDVRK